MILKVMLCQEDNQTEVFEITNYYSETGYLEADINGNENREIILQDGEYLCETANWERISIFTDQGFELYTKNNSIF